MLGLRALTESKSDFFAFDHGECRALGLRLETEFLAETNCIRVKGRVVDLEKRDRAITLLFALPVDADGWSWSDDMRRSRRIGGEAEYADLVRLPCGIGGGISRYPLAALSNDKIGLALGLDMAHPAQYRRA